MIFADRLATSIVQRKSVIVAGFDPVIETMPKFIIDSVQHEVNDEAAIFSALTSFYEVGITALSDLVAAVKPNIAFFEQYGIGGLRAFKWVCQRASDAGLPVVVDAKRGDIGSTAEAYRNAFFGSTPYGKGFVDVDAVTVNPFLGFDTLEPFVKPCIERGKGIFVLVRTSNPGSADLQACSLRDHEGDLSSLVAKWVNEVGERAMGAGGFSSIGAVVGATSGADADRLRHLMPRALFLIPGMGAQGGTAEDAVRSFRFDVAGNPAGGLINLSRGLMSSFHQSPKTWEELREGLRQNAIRFNREISGAFKR